jgi:ERF superfamily
MTEQYTMTEEATFDTATGEVVEPKLSREAMRGIRRPNVWSKKDTTHTGLIAGDEFAYAFLCVQEELRPIIATDKENPFIKKDKPKSTAGDYTSLGGLLKAIRPILSRHWITLEQYAGDVFGLTDTPGNKHLFLPVFTRLEHVPSMQSKTYKMPMPITAFTAQAVASAMTYGKRYSLMGALGISSGTDDDDGNAASINKGIDGKLGEVAEGLAEKIKAFTSVHTLKRWAEDNASGFDILEESDRQKLRVVYEDQMVLLQDGGAAAEKKAGAKK